MRILLVDDDTVILDDLRYSIHWDKLGIDRVDTAQDAATAKEILAREPVDIVISDIEMPQESGLDLLRWYRENNLKGKFLLLTCHESFRYATAALKLHAGEYLMKPFNVEMMELVLQKFIQELQREKEQESARILGQWMTSNIREARLVLWSQMLSTNPKSRWEDLIKEARNPALRIDETCDYRLVIARVTNLEADYDSYGKSLVNFILTNIQSEVFFGQPENSNILVYEFPNYTRLVTICPEMDEEKLRERCRLTQKHCAKILSATLTYCIMAPCHVGDFPKTLEKGSKLLEQCVSFYGEVFSEDQVEAHPAEEESVLQMEQLEDFLAVKDKKGFLSYLKKELEIRVKAKALDANMLKTMIREVNQVIYAHLAEQGIQISLLLNDALSLQMSAKADQSAADMIRYENYLLDKVFAYEAELEKSKGLIQQINEYIHQHYAENLTRSEIGTEFYLVPEYLAKMYKKKTGIALKDYINDYRIQQAKQMLAHSDKQVGEVAVDVGFGNLSYFSTLFKKSTGMTPVEYRKQAGKK